MPKDRTHHESGETETKHKKEKEKSPELLSHPSSEELLQQLNDAEQKAQQYWERILRMQADNENVSKRTERDIANAHKYALEKFVNDLLPIVDSLELAVNSVPKESEKTAAPIIEGVSLTLKMFYNTLEKFGVKQVDPIGQPFNPEFEQAIAMTVDPKVKPGTVISVLQKGYTLNNRLIRPALVTVAKAEE